MKSPKRALITGGGGYIGSVLTPLLLGAGYEVAVYDAFLFGRRPLRDFARHPGLTLVQGDIRDTKKLAPLLDGGTPVIHLASLSNDPSCDLDPEWSIQINHEAAVRLAAAAKAAGCGRFVFASSCSVYGFGEGKVLSETAPCNPVSLYAKLKVRTENALADMADGAFSPVFMRQATIFGVSPRMRFDLAINQMTMHAITRGKIFVLGGGRQWRPFLHVADAADAFKLALEAPREKVHRQAFNVGSDENNIQIVALAQKVKKAIGGVEVEVAPADPDRRDYHVDFRKIRRAIGFKPALTIEDGIREIASFVRRSPRRNYATGEFFNIVRMKELPHRLAPHAESAKKRPSATPARFDFIRAGEGFDLLMRACGLKRGDRVAAEKACGPWLSARLKKYGMALTGSAKGAKAVFVTDGKAPAKTPRGPYTIIFTTAPARGVADAIFWMGDVLPGAARVPAARVVTNGGRLGRRLAASVNKRTKEWMESPLAGKAVSDAFDLLEK